MESIARDGNLNEIAFCCPDLSTTSRLYNPINRVSRERQLWKLNIIDHLFVIMSKIILHKSYDIIKDYFSFIQNDILILLQ